MLLQITNICSVRIRVLYLISLILLIVVWLKFNLSHLDPL